MGDVGVYIADDDSFGWFVGPGKEDPEIIAIMDVGPCTRAFASQPLGKFLDFNVHLLPPGR